MYRTLHYKMNTEPELFQTMNCICMYVRMYVDSLLERKKYQHLSWKCLKIQIKTRHINIYVEVFGNRKQTGKKIWTQFCCWRFGNTKKSTIIMLINLSKKKHKYQQLRSSTVLSWFSIYTKTKEHRNLKNKRIIKFKKKN